MNVLISQRAQFLIPTKLIFLVDFLLLALLISSFYLVNKMPNQVDGEGDLKSNEEFKQEAERIAVNCMGKGGWECYKQAFSELTEKNGLTFTEQVLYAIQDVDPFLRNCHILAHSISQAATRKEPSRWKELLEQVNIYSCGGGFLHGVLETHMSSEPGFTITADFINNLCSNLSADEKKRMCSHGLGHLILLEKEGDLSSALPVCSGVKQDSTGMAVDCFIGLFMEDHQKLALSEHEIAKAPIFDDQYVQKLEKGCFSYDGIAAVACWNEMSEIYGKSYGFDPALIYQKCSQAPQEQERNRCFLKGVALMSVDYSFSTKNKLLSICQPYNQAGQEDGYKVCLNYVVTSLMYYSPLYIDRGIVLCSNVSDQFQENCFKDLGNQLKRNIHKQKDRETLCKGGPEKYKHYCINPQVI